MMYEIVPDRRLPGRWLGGGRAERPDDGDHTPVWAGDRATLNPCPRHWALALTAPYALCAGIAWDDLAAGDADRMRRALTLVWGVQSRRTLLAVMTEHLAAGHRWLGVVRCGDLWQLPPAEAAAFAADLRAQADTSQEVAAVLWQFGRVRADDRDVMSLDLSAWDFVRFAALARAGARLGWLADDEAIAAMLMVADDLRSRYGSWAEFGASFSAGRWFWSARAGVEEAAQDRHDRSRTAALLGADGRGPPCRGICRALSRGRGSSMRSPTSSARP